MNVHERESDSFTLFTLLTAWIHLARVAEGHVRFIRVHSWLNLPPITVMVTYCGILLSRSGSKTFRLRGAGLRPAMPPFLAAFFLLPHQRNCNGSPQQNPTPRKNRREQRLHVPGAGPGGGALAETKARHGDVSEAGT